MDYPDTRIETIEDTLAGVSFPDPYRWLEGDSDEVKRWQQRQAALASAHVREWPHFERLRELVTRFNTQRSPTVPRCVAGRWFRTRAAEGGSMQAVLADEPLGEGRVLFDSITENPEHPPALSWLSPSPDGRTLALGLCTDGSERNTVRLINVADGQRLPDPPPHTLMDAWMGGAQWLGDSSGFFFCGLSGAPSDFAQAIYLHRRSPTPGTVLADIPWTTAKDWRMVFVSPDGRHAVAIERLLNPIPVAIAAQESGFTRWKPFVTSISGTLAGRLVGNHYIGVTDVHAPRGRLVAVALDSADPNDPANWQELVAESDAVLRTVTPIAETLYLTEFVDTYTRVRIVDEQGKALGEVPLPERGSVYEAAFPLLNLVPNGHPDKWLFAFSSPTVSPGLYRHAPDRPALETLRAPQVRLEQSVVEDHWAISFDGTRIPYHIIRRLDVSATQPQGTLIYAYGGLNAPLLPQFLGPMSAFVAAGGVLVHAHLRGGGEFGRDWWDAGRLHLKQNGYEDLYAVTEDLIAKNRSAPDLLAVTGRSGGGLMAGVAVTQRPDLWKVAIPRVPFLDLIGACRDPYGRNTVAMEFADVEDPDDVRRLATFSPYQLVRPGVSYPAVFMDAGDTDPRCPAWHAAKFAARLQQATSGSAPILLHVWANVGHFGGADPNVEVDLHTEWLAFTLRHLGIEMRPRGSQG